MKALLLVLQLCAAAASSGSIFETDNTLEIPQTVNIGLIGFDSDSTFDVVMDEESLKTILQSTLPTITPNVIDSNTQLYTTYSINYQVDHLPIIQEVEHVLIGGMKRVGLGDNGEKIYDINTTTSIENDLEILFESYYATHTSDPTTTTTTQFGFNSGSSSSSSSVSRCSSWSCSCQGMSDCYSVDGDSVEEKERKGVITSYMLHWWQENECQSVPSGRGCIDCTPWGCTCQGMSDCFGVHYGVGWGSADADVHMFWWESKGCKTIPTTSLCSGERGGGGRSDNVCWRVVGQGTDSSELFQVADLQILNSWGATARKGYAIAGWGDERNNELVTTLPHSSTKVRHSAAYALDYDTHTYWSSTPRPSHLPIATLPWVGVRYPSKEGVKGEVETKVGAVKNSVGVVVKGVGKGVLKGVEGEVGMEGTLVQSLWGG